MVGRIGRRDRVAAEPLELRRLSALGCSTRHFPFGFRLDPIRARNASYSPSQNLQLQATVETESKIVVFGVTHWVPCHTGMLNVQNPAFKGRAQIACQPERSHLRNARYEMRIRLHSLPVSRIPYPTSKYRTGALASQDLRLWPGMRWLLHSVLQQASFCLRILSAVRDGVIHAV